MLVHELNTTEIEGNQIIISGKFVKTASVHDEEWLEGQVVQKPEAYLAKLTQSKADIFTFSQKIPEIEPRFPYFYELDNVAAIPLNKFEDWWEKRLPQESRKNVRRAGRRGVTVRVEALTDKLVQGITEIYNETPIRQGIPFAHYGKEFKTIKSEVSGLPERSIFLGAYFGDELIGFIKLIEMGPITSILHIVSKNAHYDKRPTNALIAKAVELCCQKGKSYLVYGKYTYGNKKDNSLTEFKDRNGFEKILLPRYYVAMTWKGKLFIKLGLHRGLLGILPPRLIRFLLGLRSWSFQKLVLPIRGPVKSALPATETTA
jgi:hypothetical protein